MPMSKEVHGVLNYLTNHTEKYDEVFFVVKGQLIEGYKPKNDRRIIDIVYGEEEEYKEIYQKILSVDRFFLRRVEDVDADLATLDDTKNYILTSWDFDPLYGAGELRAYNVALHYLNSDLHTDTQDLSPYIYNFVLYTEGSEDVVPQGANVHINRMFW